MALLAVGQAAIDLLTLVQTTAAAESVELPDRQYVTASASGNEAWDCDQVVVGLLQLNPSNAAGGNSGEWSGGSGGGSALPTIPEVYLRIEIVRAVPVLGRKGTSTPQPDEQSRGLQALQDAALLHAVRAKVMSGAWITGGQPSDVRLGPILPAGAEGGYASMALVIGSTIFATTSP